MVVIDSKTDKAYESVSKAEAARIIGVSRMTIINWSKRGVKQVYNSFTVYFNVQRMKQKKGKAIIKKKVVIRR